MASARVQRWALILGAYSYSIAYKPGTAIPHADALSRLPLLDIPETTPEQQIIYPLPLLQQKQFANGLTMIQFSLEYYTWH